MFVEMAHRSMALALVVWAVMGTHAASASWGIRGEVAKAKTIRTNDFVVGRGKTRTISSDTRVLARDDILIQGTLLIAGGTDVTLKAADSLTLGPAARVAAAPVSHRAADPVGVEQLGNIEFTGSKLVVIKGDVTAPFGTSIKVASAEFGTVKILGKLTTKDGRTSQRPGYTGENAGAITVGGFFGSNAAVVLRRATLTAGAGGTGYSPTRPEAVGLPNPCQDHDASGLGRAASRFIATDGGKGGTVRLWGKNIMNKRSTVTVGRGGTGGSAGIAAVVSPQGDLGHGGSDVFALSGDGGEGGSIVLSGDYTGDPIRTGRGGDAGDVRAAAGKGANGCDGGRTEVVLGRPGWQGLLGKGVRKASSAGRMGVVELKDGGNGGSALTPDQSAGDGGKVIIRLQSPRERKPRDPPANFGGYYFKRIEATRYGNGGAGYNDCLPSAEETRGTDGGAGSAVRIARVVWFATDSFNGGNGGNGLPPGVGGTAGTAVNKPDTPVKSFLAGGAGSPCPPSLHEYSLAGSLSMSWEWPPDQEGDRAPGGSVIPEAKACGGDPATLVWQLKVGNTPVSADFKKNNPAPVSIYHYGTEATVRGFLHLTKDPLVMALEATKEGDVNGPTFNPGSVPINSVPVSSCP